MKHAPAVSNVVHLKSPRRDHGWVAISRDIFDHDIVGADVPAPKGARADRPVWQPMIVWQWMICEASHQPFARFVKGRRYQVQRGQLIVSQRFLAQKANWGRGAIRGFFERLEMMGMITTSAICARDGQLLLDFAHAKASPESNPALTIVTICNYDRYQLLYPTAQPTLQPTSSPPPAQSTTTDTDMMVLHQSRRDSDSRKRETENFEIDGAPLFSESTIAALSKLHDEALIQKVVDRITKQQSKPNAKRIADLDAYLVRAVQGETAKQLKLTPAQVKAMTTGSKTARIEAAAKAVGVYNRPSPDLLTRWARRRRPQEQIDQIISQLAKRDFQSQEQADRAAEQAMANTHFRSRS